MVTTNQQPEPGPEPGPSWSGSGFEGWGDADDAPRAGEALIVNLEGFEGPLDLLLALARTQKVDLAKISVLALAEQYLAFVNQALKAAAGAGGRLSGDGGLAGVPQVQAPAAARRGTPRTSPPATSWLPASPSA